jgi:predicted Zn-dependent protease
MYTGAGLLAFGTSYYVYHLDTVPISNRRRFLDITPKQEQAIAQLSYNEIMTEYGKRILPASHPYTQFVRRVAKRIIQVSGMRDLKWEVHVIDHQEPNAFVLPGGKVFVFTGILPLVQDEDGMAAILGHEVAHQVARHTAEKLSFTKVVLAASCHS